MEWGVVAVIAVGILALVLVLFLVFLRRAPDETSGEGSGVRRRPATDEEEGVEDSGTPSEPKIMLGDPAIDDQDGSVYVDCVVNGEPLRMWAKWEALQRRFGAKGPRDETEALRLIRENISLVEEVLRKHLKEMGMPSRPYLEMGWWQWADGRHVGKKGRRSS